MGWHHVADLTDFAELEILGRQIGERQIALFKLGDALHATSGWCTHAQVLLCRGEIVDGLIECPGHFGYFDIVSGKAQGAPVTRDLETYPVRIVGAQVHIDLP